jgi:hypothetical protein
LIASVLIALDRVGSVPADLEPVLADDIQPQQLRIEESQVARRPLDLAGALIPLTPGAGDDDVADFGVHRAPLLWAGLRSLIVGIREGAEPELIEDPF